jgi:hypothetical protein
LFTLDNHTQKDRAILHSIPKNVSPLAQASVLLLARTLSQHFALPHPSVEEILGATAASRSRAYELMATLVALLPTIVRPVGRPAAQTPATPSVPNDAAVTLEVLDYIMRHPGCVRSHPQRQWYSNGFRHFILALRERNSTISLEAFASLVRVPEGTLKVWLSPSVAPPSPSPEPTCTEAANAEGYTLSPRIEAVLTAWATWEGTFGDFTNYVRNDLRIPMGRQLIAYILEATGVRLRNKRRGRSPDELALRGGFETFFPGAQWVGDGKKVSVTVDEDTFALNLELNVDAHSGAFVGLSVRNTEDSTAVVECFNDGIATTGSPPLAQLLDNKCVCQSPSNEKSRT